MINHRRTVSWILDIVNLHVHEFYGEAHAVFSLWKAVVDVLS